MRGKHRFVGGLIPSGIETICKAGAFCVKRLLANAYGMAHNEINFTMSEKTAFV